MNYLLFLQVIYKMYKYNSFVLNHNSSQLKMLLKIHVCKTTFKCCLITRNSDEIQKMLFARHT